MEYSVFDAHCDTLCKVMDEGADFLNNSAEVDLLRLSSYKHYTQVMACFISLKYSKHAKERTLDLVKTYHHTINKYKKENVDTILSIENMEGFTNLYDVDMFYNMGVRMASLTWNNTNHLAGGVEDKDSTLTAFGAEVVKRMNKKGMLLDVSHLNDKSFYEAAEICTMPIIASHSNSRLLCDNPRNITDDMFKVIVKSGGVVGINVYPPMVSDKKDVYTEDIVRHIEHFMDISGDDNIGIGADFDGMDGILPVDIQGCEDLYKIFDRLLALNYSEETVNKISHANFMRVFKDLK